MTLQGNAARRYVRWWVVNTTWQGNLQRRNWYTHVLFSLILQLFFFSLLSPLPRQYMVKTTCYSCLVIKRGFRDNTKFVVWVIFFYLPLFIPTLYLSAYSFGTSSFLSLTYVWKILENKVIIIYVRYTNAKETHGILFRFQTTHDKFENRFYSVIMIVNLIRENNFKIKNVHFPTGNYSKKSMSRKDFFCGWF